MKFYFAPMEGITGYIYRNAFEQHFGGISKFQKQQRYDLRKQEYCSIKNIPLIIINYNQEITEETIIRKEYL